MKISPLVHLATLLVIVADTLCFLIGHSIPGTLSDATLVLVGGSAGVSLPGNSG